MIARTAGLTEEARRALEEELCMCPDNVAACDDLAVLLQKIGKQQQAALVSCQRSLAITSDSQTRQQRINTLNSLGKHARATRCSRRWMYPKSVTYRKHPEVAAHADHNVY